MQSLLKVNRLFSKHLLKDLTAIRHGSYRNPKLVSDDLSKYTNYEVTQNPEEWKYVEQLLPDKLIPEPKYEPNLPSGYKPPTVKPGKILSTPTFIWYEDNLASLGGLE